MQSDKSSHDLTKQMNKDLLNLPYLLRANKLFLTVPYKFKNLQGKQPIPPQSVKYLGVLLDEHLQWAKQLSNFKVNLNTTIGTLSKLKTKYQK